MLTAPHGEWLPRLLSSCYRPEIEENKETKTNQSEANEWK